MDMNNSNTKYYGKYRGTVINNVDPMLSGRLMLSVPEKPEFQNYSSVIYYRVGDIQKGYEALLARGVSFEDKPHLIARMPDHELWMAFFRDPDSNLLALMCEIPL